MAWPQGLEKNPLATVAPEPAELLDRMRYQQCQRTLSDGEEAQVAMALEGMRAAAAKQGLLVKPYFDDASRDANSVRRINHITASQFKQVRRRSRSHLARSELCLPPAEMTRACAQVINSKLALKVAAEDLDLIIEKYTDPAYGDLVNYVAFACAVDPREVPYDPYTLGM